MADLTLVRNALLRRDSALLLAAIGLIFIAIGGFYFSGQSGPRDAGLSTLFTELHGHARAIGDLRARVSTAAPLPVAEVAEAGAALDPRVQREIVGRGWLDPAAAEAAEAVGAAWQRSREGVQSVQDHAAAYDTVRQQSAALMPQLSEMAAATVSLSDQLASQNAPGRQIQLASLLTMRLERVAAALPKVLGQGRDAIQGAEALRLESAYFVNDLAQLLNGNDGVPALRADAALAQAQALQERYQSVVEGIAMVVEAAPRVETLQQQAADLAASQQALTDALDTLKRLDGGAPDRGLPVVSIIALVLAIGAIAAFFLVFARTSQSGSAESEQRDARQQQAILGLLDEITNLADGDLTVDVTVTEDFTGAIADSINYTVQNMRALVGTINNTSEQLAQSAAQTQDIAARMNLASERQAKDVTAVTTQISATSQQMQQVAGRAEQLARQAQESVAVAHNGAQTVDRTIQGMNTLREQIQDTAKRIKRLGESSQEIGNIIELINDIAEQTSTLALNASIQAAMAGEQGRGFAVVAEEVQRLAERASTATRQIENLVKTIQADTNEAIISMERSTHNVVSGARSAEEAGGALTQVETSSQQIARLIQEISGAARNQSAAATTIAGQMQNIRDIAVQTSGSAGQTAHAIGELNALSEKLRASVAGFKLPE